MSIRARLALWYGSLLSLVLGAALTAAYLGHGDAHLAEVDAELGRAWDAAAALIRSVGSDQGMLAGLRLADPDHEPFMSLVDALGRPIATSGRLEPSIAGVLGSLPDGATTITANGPDVRVLIRAIDGTRSVRLAATISLTALDASLTRLRTLLLGLAVGGILVALGGGWAIAAGALRPIALLTSTARTIAASRAFSRRLPVVRRHDELGELAQTLNDMLASLDAAYRLEQRFVSDTSHELRTPLTTAHANAQLLVQDDADPEDRHEAASQILRETTRLKRLIDELLAIARADAETEPLDGKRVQLDEVLMEAFEELRPQAGQRLRVLALDEAAVLGDRDGLKQVALILLDNALRYTPGDGCVEASVAIEDRTGVLRVDDTGIGIDPEVEAHAFDRFYRGGDARRMAPEGTGLGLSIARWIVDRHGGSIELRPRDPGGTSAVVRLPLAGAHAGDHDARRDGDMPASSRS